MAYYLVYLAQVALITPAFLIAVSFHEFSHALVATLLGDNTPKMTGRLTLNPFKHIDITGLVFLLIFRIGWAKPVLFNPNNFKRPKLYSILVGLAGPFCNFVLVIFFLYVIEYLPSMSLEMNNVLTGMLNFTVYVNAMLGVFNLLPIPPLDGSHMLYALLPNRYKHFYFDFSRYSIFLLLFLFYIPATRNSFISMIKYTIAFLTKFVV